MGGQRPGDYSAQPPDPRLPRELNLQGEVVAIVAADTEDLADDALRRIKVEYEVLPFVSTLKEVMAPGAPDLRGGKGNLIRPANAPREFPNATWGSQAGDVEKGFAEADIVKEFEYHFAGAVSVPMQPSGSVAKWDGDKLTFWGMGQGIYPVRDGAGRRRSGWIRRRSDSSTSGTDRRSAPLGSPPSASIRSSRISRR